MDHEFTLEVIVISDFAIKVIGGLYAIKYDNQWQPIESGYKNFQMKPASSKLLPNQLLPR